MAEFAKKEKTTRKDVIIELIREIGKKSLTEFRGGYTRKIDHSTWIEEIYVPDSRKEYIQGIEFLSDILSADFDSKMNKMNEELLKNMDGNLKEYEEDKIDYEDYIIKKLKLIRKLLQELMSFLKRDKFWKKETTFG